MIIVLLKIHSIVRWLLLSGLIFSIYRASVGLFGAKAFRVNDNRLRHWTATLAHIQMLIGMWLYMKTTARQLPFFGFFHISGMLTAVVIITIGSSMAKRKQDAKQKFQTMLIWFGLALFIIVICIPWPFSPWVSRPYIRI